jgi:hypothetical protein
LIRAAEILAPHGSRYAKAVALERAIRRFERTCGPPESVADRHLAEAFRAGAPMVRTWRRLLDQLPTS